MAPQDEEWTPKLVRPPEKNPEGRTYFDWNDQKLNKWKADAIKMQEAHVKDNNRTEWFAYTSEERDAIELRILMTVYGIRTPQDGTKGIPSCPLKTYTREERLQARKIKKMIVKNSGCPEKILFNVIYISTATKLEDSDEFLASEEPVFVVKKCRKFVDKDGKAYTNFEAYKENNNLPKGPMLVPQNGSYTPQDSGANGGDSDGKVPLEAVETPAAASPLKRIGAVTDTIAMVGGIALSVTGVVTLCAPAAFSAAAMAVIQGTSFGLTGYTIAGALHGIYDKTSRDESIRTEALLLAASAFAACAGRLNSYLKIQPEKYARLGKTFEELTNETTRARHLFAAFNIISVVSSTATLVSSFIELLNKKERTWLDYYHVCMALFSATNVLTKPITIQYSLEVFESEQSQYLNQIKDNLASDEAKQQMSSTVEQNSASDQKAYLIRNLNKIESPTEFFELINKTGSVIGYTADGLAVNNKIDIHPECYNEIGKAVFQDKIVQITRFKENALHENLLKEFGRNVSPERLEEFKNELDQIKNLDVDKKAAIRDIVKKFQTDVSATEHAFNASWDKADKASNVENQINKMIKNLQEGIPKEETGKQEEETRKREEETGKREEGIRKREEESGKREDFKRLNVLASKQIDGTIEPEEKQELQQKIDKCSRHRKEYFLQSSAGDSKDANIPENNESFKEAINTFTNGQNERLCYRVDVEQVKSKLQDTFNQPNVEDITVNGKKIFANMKIGEYDRLHRVLKEYGPTGDKLMTAAARVASDPTFAGQVNTPHDIASITEAINTHIQKVPEAQRQAYLDNLAADADTEYNTFRNNFNEKIHEVSALDPSVRSQWTSPLSMAYHGWKHDKLGGQPVTIAEYFGQHANNLFTTENRTVQTHDQSGNFRENYMRSFGKRIHVGFTTGPDQTRASQFDKRDTR